MFCFNSEKLNLFLAWNVCHAILQSRIFVLLCLSLTPVFILPARWSNHKECTICPEGISVPFTVWSFTFWMDYALKPLVVRLLKSFISFLAFLCVCFVVEVCWFTMVLPDVMKRIRGSIVLGEEMQCIEKSRVGVLFVLLSCRERIFSSFVGILKCLLKALPMLQPWSFLGICTFTITVAIE